ncbi:MAG: hypothetical protein WBP72_07155 [Rhodocyclaceae bacterium]
MSFSGPGIWGSEGRLPVARWSLAALVTLMPPHAAVAGPSHCAAKEQALFSCSTGRKTVSVCASAALSATEGRLQYRFGRPKAPEFAYPPNKVNWRQVTRGGVLTFSGGGGAYLAFASRPYRYIVYTAIGKGWGEKAGLVVEKNGRRTMNLPCKGKETSELGPDLFAAASIPEDSASFDLP